MASITGKTGAVTIAGSAVTGKIREWSLEIEASAAESTGAGDAWKAQEYLTSQWIARFTAILPTGSGADFYPASIGTDVVIALKRASADTNPVFTDTGMLKSIRLVSPAQDVTTYEVVVEGNAGDAPTFDTSPTA